MRIPTNHAAVIGLQWGDEGKGKILDIFAPNFDCVARFNGGPNAGHTVIVDGHKYVLHIIPSSILTKTVIPIIGSGVIVDLPSLFKEIDELTTLGVDCSHLKISHLCHLILPYHKIIDTIREAKTEKIGTTKRGIGPCYADFVSRFGIRIVDLYNEKRLRELIEVNVIEKQAIISGYQESTKLCPDEIFKELMSFKERLDPYVVDVERELYGSGKRILFEGAQGVMLDINQGTYPYVTSTSTLTTAITQSMGVPLSEVENVVGVVKAYTTRIGTGPFPTEMPTDLAARLREQASEYGATTGRPRRCGWLDLYQLKHAVALTETDELVMTKLDSLFEIEPLKIAIDYQRDSRFFDWSCVTPVYKEFAPFPKISSQSIKTWDDFPNEIKEYVSFVEDELCTPITWLSIGPERKQIIKKRVEVYF